MAIENNKRPLLGDHKKSTTELLGNIRAIVKNDSDRDFNNFMSSNQDEFSYNPQVGNYIRDILGERIKDVKIKDLAALTGISKSYLYQIIPVKSKPPKTIKGHPDRRMLIAIALCLNFSLDETQHLLRYANEKELYPRTTFDTVIIYALERGGGLVKANILLNDNGCEILDWHKEKDVADEDDFD